MRLSAKNEYRVLILVGAIFVVGGCLAARPAWHSYRFRNSVPVPAEISELGIKTTRKSSSTTALYTYTYSGILYSSSSVSPAADQGRVYRQLKDAAEHYAYVDPDQPNRAYLDPVLPPFERYASLSFGILFPVAGASLVILGGRRIRASGSRRQNPGCR